MPFDRNNWHVECYRDGENHPMTVFDLGHEETKTDQTKKKNIDIFGAQLQPCFSNCINALKVSKLTRAYEIDLPHQFAHFEYIFFM